MNDFTNYNGTGDFMGFKSRANECHCLECDQLRAKAAAERMKAATCKCGHVGAECFNDEWCNPDHDCLALNCVGVHRTDYNAVRKENEHIKALLANAVAEIDQLKHSRVPNETAEFWRNAFMECGDTATQVEIAMANKITELEQEVERRRSFSEIADRVISRQEDEINDLQADYAKDCIVWAGMYNSLSETHYGEEWKELNRVEELETTIRVLAGMVS